LIFSVLTIFIQAILHKNDVHILLTILNYATMKKYYLEWLIKAPLGLILVGAGVCMITEAAFFKHSGARQIEWVTAGTVSLVVFNAGLCVFGSSILSRVRYERAKSKESRGR
jgi:uncharacterized integral membrane protein